MASRGALCGCHPCRSGGGCRVVQSACAGAPSAVPAVSGSCINTAPVAGSHRFTATERRLTALSAADPALCASRNWTVCFLLAVCHALPSSRQLHSTCVMAASGGTPDDARSGISFGVELQVPWNVPNVLGLTGRRPDPAKVRLSQGRDERSIRALVPDPRIVDGAFHDVTIVDMENTREPAISDSDLHLLRLQ